MIFSKYLQKIYSRVRLGGLDLPHKFTLLFVPQDSNFNTKSFTLSKRTIKITSVSLLLFFLLFLFMFLLTINSVRKELQLKIAISEREKMEKELSYVNKQLETINSQYKMIKEISQKISEIAEIDIGRKGLGIGAIIGKEPTKDDIEADVDKEIIKNTKTDATKDQSFNYGDNYSKNIIQVSSTGAILLNNLNTLLGEAEYKRDFLKAIPVNWPTSGKISSSFGYRIHPFSGAMQMHDGLDIASGVGTPVYATANGVVIQASYSEDYGKMVYVKHDRKIQTRYGHLSKVIVKNGQKVKRGEIIGYLGNSGRSTGPHLHYEIRINNIPLDPLRFIIVSPYPSAPDESTGVAL